MDRADELISRCHQDPAAFRELVGLFKMRIYSFIIHLAGPRPADDLFQEVWLRAFKGAPNYKPEGKAASWLFRIAHNVCLRHFERDKRQGVETGLDELAPLAAPTPGPAAAVELTETERRIHEAIDALPQEQRQVFLMREFGGLAFKEVAETLDIPLGTALSRMNAALEKLRRSLEDLRA